MPRVHREALVAYSAEQMFALVNDVARYPEFLPGCASADILQQTDSSMRAALTLAKGGFRQAFTTLNDWQAPQRLSMKLVEGPFKHLDGVWVFESLGDDACKVSVTIDFEFSSLIGSLAFGPAFQRLVHSLIEAFHQRAKEVYGV